MLRTLFLFAMFCVIAAGCGDTYYVTADVANDIISDPIEITVETTSDPVSTPEYNPFRNSLEHIESAVDVIEQDFLTIVAMDGGLDVLHILLKEVSLERKAALIIDLPTTTAKTMLLQASVDHLDTIDTLSALFAGPSKKNAKTKQKASDGKAKQDPDDPVDDASDVIGTIIAAIVG